MEGIRTPLQGTWNIIRFNRHFYFASIASVILLLLLLYKFPAYYISIVIICFALFASTIISLLVSFYVYDLSGFYQLTWLDEINVEAGIKMVNVHAGFDETSSLLKRKFPAAELIVLDFYDPVKHTEISIRRARKAYPSYANTIEVNTLSLPLEENSVDLIFLIFAAHEIRSEEERTQFFNELVRCLNAGGKIILTEHLRNLPNFLAYNIGFFHFIPETSWKRTFKSADLMILKEIKFTPFITTFILQKNGTAS